MKISFTDIIVNHIDHDPGMILVEERTTSGFNKKKKLEKNIQVIRKVLRPVLRQVQAQARAHPVPHQATNHKVNLLKS